MDELPITVVLAPAPMALAPMTILFESLLSKPRTLLPMYTLLPAVVKAVIPFACLLAAAAPSITLFPPVIFMAELSPITTFELEVVLADKELNPSAVL